MIRSFCSDERSRLVQLSFLMLFVELVLIRWTASNIYYLFAFSNFVLIACFLGIGIGFLRSQTSKNHFALSPVYLTIIIIFCYVSSLHYHPVIDKITGNLDYSGQYFKNNIYPLWLTMPLIFLMVTFLMASIADGVARSFQTFVPLNAYRLEILGSILGISVFSILSFVNASPLYWGIVIVLLYTSLLWENWQRTRGAMACIQITALLVLAGIFAHEAFTPSHFWSSYYKIIVNQYAQDSYAINVNNLVQQVVEPVAQRKMLKPFYFLPYEHAAQHLTLDNVLIIGAGTGGDVAIALAEGAKHVDAVEIDPMLYRLGKKLNANHPYFDPRVNVYINDGRAFLQQSQRRYDLIIFALTDSLMLIPGQSSLRLENYLYTIEGITVASQHLKPGGVFAIYNYYREPWLVNRLGNTLDLVFKHKPCLDNYSAKDYWATVLTSSLDSQVLVCPLHWQDTTQQFSTPATDNHPFLYLKENKLSALYIMMLIFIFATACCFIRRYLKESYVVIKQYADLFLMGAAFLLLETMSIIHFALLFGTTWFVNALVFLGILLTVYLAIEFTQQLKNLKPSMLYIALLISLIISWLVPPSYLLTLNMPLRFMAESALVFSPVFIANIIFANRFRQTINSVSAFGVNLMGAVLGGLLEYSSLVIGYQNLLLLIAVLYGFSILIMLRKSLILGNQ